MMLKSNHKHRRATNEHVVTSQIKVYLWRKSVILPRLSTVYHWRLSHWFHNTRRLKLSWELTTCTNIPNFDTNKLLAACINLYSSFTIRRRRHLFKPLGLLSLNWLKWTTWRLSSWSLITTQLAMQFLHRVISVLNQVIWSLDQCSKKTCKISNGALSLL